MSAAIRDSLHRLLVAAVHLWVTQFYLDRGDLPRDWTSWVYARNLEWGADLLRGKRIRVTLEIEDWPEGREISE